MEMETSETSREAAASFHQDTISNHHFKTPKLLKTSVRSRTRFEESGFLETGTPDFERSSTSHMNCSSDWGYKSYSLCTPELRPSTQRCDSNGLDNISSRVDFSSSICGYSTESSLDSGLGSIDDCESMIHSVDDSVDIEIGALDQSELSPTSAQKRPGTPTKSSSCKIPCMVSTPFKADNHVSYSLWQSTPSFESRPNCKTLNFGTPFMGITETKPTSAKSYRLCKSSRDLYQPCGRRTCDSSPAGSLCGSVTPSPLKTSHVGRDSVDIMSFLGLYSRLQPALDIILGYLEPPDLCRASQVSQSWKNIIETVPSAKNRKKTFVEQRMQSKENLCQSVKKSEDEEPSSSLPRRGQLVAIHNLNRKVDASPAPTRSPPVSPSKVRFHLFVKEAHKLENGQTLVQCPKCKLPSVRETVRAAKCTRRGCQFHFCLHCFCEFHGDHPCRVFGKHSRRQAAIGSRESRRNLKRL